MPTNQSPTILSLEETALKIEFLSIFPDACRELGEGGSINDQELLERLVTVGERCVNSIVADLKIPPLPTPAPE